MKADLTAEQYLKKVLSTEVIDEQCPVHRTLNILNGKWRTHIIFELCKQESLRFGELKKSSSSNYELYADFYASRFRKARNYSS